VVPKIIYQILVTFWRSHLALKIKVWKRQGQAGLGQEMVYLLGKVRLGKVRLGKFRLGKFRLGKFRLGKFRLVLLAI